MKLCPLPEGVARKENCVVALCGVAAVFTSILTEFQRWIESQSMEQAELSRPVTTLLQRGLNLKASLHVLQGGEASALIRVAPRPTVIKAP